MDEKDFKKHLQDLVHGPDHPEEHDWPDGGAVRKTDETVETDAGKSTKSIVRKRRRPAK